MTTYLVVCEPVILALEAGEVNKAARVPHKTGHRRSNVSVDLVDLEVKKEKKRKELDVYNSNINHCDNAIVMMQL